MEAPSPEAERRVAIFRSPLFNPSETFVTGHVAGLRRYRPILVGLVRKGSECPPGTPMLLPRSAVERLSLTLAGRAGALGRRLEAERPDLIHAHFGTDGLLALPIAERLGIPLVTTLHGYDVSRRPLPMLLSGRLSWIRYALLKRRLIERGDRFLAVSDAVRARAIATGYPAKRIFTLRNGVDTDLFSPALEAPDPGLILHVGRLVEKKGTRLLLYALRVVPQGNLVIIGDGPERRPLEDLARRLGIAERVRFPGRLPPVAVRDWMRRAWLLAVPSLTARDGDSEGLPTVICEAAATGLPVVASIHSGIPEAVVGDKTGLLVLEGDVDGLANGIAALVGNTRLRARMGAAARRLAEDRFCRRRQIDRLEAHYDLLLGCD
jgi:colanic acid/amylovoran biosynthesis glycosyltransferase